MHPKGETEGLLVVWLLEKYLLEAVSTVALVGAEFNLKKKKDVKVRGNKRFSTVWCIYIQYILTIYTYSMYTRYMKRSFIVFLMYFSHFR